MGLSLYNQKRHFNKTSEPEGKEKSSKGALRFVVQKHDASHLHYDFRLEMDGVLKSWAVPKGPSLNPAEKRLAMAVEDHPYDYKDFEGVIPAGEYGGGTVIVWDEGTYEPMEAGGLSRKEQAELLLQQLKKGDLKLTLHGEKLKGNFALFRMKTRGDNTWLLVKKNDEHATEDDVRLQNESVKTGKSLADVAEDHGTEVNHPGEDLPEGTINQKNSKKETRSTTTSVQSKKTGNDASQVKNLLAGKAAKSKKPENIVPMMAVLVDEPFDNDKWIFEVKWDGYRAVAYCDGSRVALRSRNLKSFDAYAPVVNALRKLKMRAVLDGEIVAVTEEGFPNFQLLQNWQNTPAQLQFYVFDILWIDGYDVTGLTLLERKEILQKLLPADNDIVKFSGHIPTKGKEFFNVALDRGLEGIMAKRAESTYRIGARSDDWLKVKVNQRQEVVIAGFTKPRNSREHFGALLLGVYEGNDLVYVGHTGSGFNAQSLKEVYGKLQKLVTDKCPFKARPKTNQPATWVKPQLVCEIKFSEWTKEGIARHPIFMGLRTDKKAKDVRLEKAKDTDAVKKAKPAKKLAEPPKKSSRNVSSPSTKKASTSKKKIRENGRTPGRSYERKGPEDNIGQA